jgi:hypothetical protein
MCETMQSSHRLCPAMALVRASLAPTASGDDAGERFCAPLPPSAHFSGACPEKTYEFPKIRPFLRGTLKSKSLGSQGGVGWEFRGL